MFIPPAFTQVAFRYRCPGDPEEMVTTLGFAGVVSNTTEALDVAGQWFGEMGDLLDEDYTFVGVTCIVGQDGDPLTYEAEPNFSGNTDFETLPPNCTMLIQKRTGTGGRKNRGRMYLPCVNKAGVLPNGDLVTGDQASYTTHVSDAVTAIIESTSNDLTFPVVLHTSSLDEPTVITSFQCSSKIATQRRRLRP